MGNHVLDEKFPRHCISSHGCKVLDSSKDMDLQKIGEILAPCYHVEWYTSLEQVEIS